MKLECTKRRASINIIMFVANLPRLRCVFILLRGGPGGSKSESTSRRQAMEPKPVLCRQKGAKLTRNIDRSRR